jgi:hypothetical protein
VANDRRLLEGWGEDDTCHQYQAVCFKVKFKRVEMKSNSKDHHVGLHSCIC